MGNYNLLTVQVAKMLGVSEVDLRVFGPNVDPKANISQMTSSGDPSEVAIQAKMVVSNLGIDHFASEASKELPKRYVLFQEGNHEIEGVGTYRVNQDAWRIVKAGIDRRGLDIVFDYEHQTLSGAKSPAAGWCTDWKWIPGVGIEAKISWTKAAEQHLLKGEYRYYSPVFSVRNTDKLLVGVHSLALTNTPRTNHMAPLVAKDVTEPVNLVSRIESNGNGNLAAGYAEMAFSVGKRMGVTKEDILKFGPSE